MRLELHIRNPHKVTFGDIKKIADVLKAAGYNTRIESEDSWNKYIIVSKEEINARENPFGW